MINQNPYIDYTTRDYEGFREDLINTLKLKIPEYSDFSESDVGIVIIELLSYGLDILSYYNDKVANELFLDTAQERESLIKLCKMLNYTIKGAKSSKVYQVLEITPRDTPFILAKGTRFHTESQNASEEVVFELESDFTIPPNCNGLEKDVDGKYLYKLPLIQGYTITNDIIGTSNETAYQTFKLNFKPVVQDSIQVYVNEGDGYQLWGKVDNFIDTDLYGEVYKAYENSDNETTIEFGTGSSGKIPKKYQNGIISTYRVGGGTIGNVTANSIIKMVDNIAGIVNTFNPEVPYELGQDGEDTDEIRINAPASLRVTGNRAVTLADYKDLALLKGDILLASARSTADSTITLDVIMDNNISLTSDMQKDLEDYFDDKKIVGYNVVVQEAIKKPMDLTVNVTSTSRYKNSAIQTAIADALNVHFTLGTYDIGQEFIVSSLIAELVAIDGVKKVQVVVDTVDETVPLNGVPILGVANITVTGGV